MVKLKRGFEVLMSTKIACDTLRFLCLDILGLSSKLLKRIVIFFWILASTCRKMIIQFWKFKLLLTKSTFILNMGLIKLKRHMIKDLFFLLRNLWFSKQIFQHVWTGWQSTKDLELFVYFLKSFHAFCKMDVIVWFGGLFVALSQVRITRDSRQALCVSTY